MRVLFLDVDGVLNRTGFRPGMSAGLRSWIEPELAHRLCDVIEKTGVAIVLSSDWRVGRELAALSDELRVAGIAGTLVGTTPVLERQDRWREIDAWIRAQGVSLEDVAIVDDGFDMGPLAPRFVRTSPLAGLDEGAARALVALFEYRHGRTPKLAKQTGRGPHFLCAIRRPRASCVHDAPRPRRCVALGLCGPVR